MTENVVVTQLTLATLFAGLLSYLKAKAWMPWFNQHSAKINHIFLATTALFGSIGIHKVWDPAAHTLLITGLSPIAIATGLWEWIKQWAVQYLVQRGAFGPVAIPGDAPASPATPVKAADLKQ